MNFDIKNPENIEVIKERKNLLDKYHKRSIFSCIFISFCLSYECSKYISFFENIFAFAVFYTCLYGFSFVFYDYNECNEVKNNDCEKLLEMTSKNENVKNYILLTNKQNRPIHNYEYSQLYVIVETQDRNEMMHERERQQRCHFDNLYNKLK